MLLRLSDKYAIPAEFQLGTTIENENYFILPNCKELLLLMKYVKMPVELTKFVTSILYSNMSVKMSF